MRLKLDENLPLDLAGILSNRGHEVDTVADEGLAGADDQAIHAAATHDQRVIMTLDRGFGDVRRYPPGSHAGVIVLRPISQDPASIGVVEPERVRVRRPPR